MRIYDDRPRSVDRMTSSYLQAEDWPIAHDAVAVGGVDCDGRNKRIEIRESAEFPDEKNCNVT
jgi:hypothetical protein